MTFKDIITAKDLDPEAVSLALGRAVIVTKLNAVDFHLQVFSDQKVMGLASLSCRKLGHGEMATGPVLQRNKSGRKSGKVECE